MELIRFIAETIMAWARDIAINLSGRVAEEFVGRRLKARRKIKRRRKRAPKRRPIIPSVFDGYSRLVNTSARPVTVSFCSLHLSRRFPVR